jgi:diguanylate cyclase (GGDEF)-like protein
MSLAEVAASSIRLLIVEDDLATATLLRDLLESTASPPIETRHVATASAACDVLERGDADVVLLDLGLPDARGLEALGQLRRCRPDIPLVILTGNADEKTALEALNHGAEDYLVKATVDRSGLVRSIRYAIERHRNVRELETMKRQLETANESLERMTMLDPLTDLQNRRGIQHALSQEIERVQRYGEAVAVLLIDIDDFKQINEKLGHAIGDVALKELARRIRGSVRGVDCIGRLGGDEFMLLLPNVADTSEVVRIAERVRLLIATSIIQHTGGTISLTASIAVLMLTTDTPSVDQLLARMHELLSRGKREGKNRVVFELGNFDDTDRRAKAQADMCTQLSAGKNLVTIKQPILRLADESPVAYEFLSRYSNGIFEVPDTFFRVCAERNILTLVDHFCLKQAVDVATALPPYLRFHINVFPSTLLAIPTEHLLQSFPEDIPPSTFCLEISEQQIIGDPSHLLAPVNGARAAGLLIAIDDVGYGSSCLESLIALEPDVIKIDKRCVIGIASDPRLRKQLARYIALTKVLGAELVAEGVETAQDLAVLRDFGIEYAQGYYWGQPG